SISFSDAAIVSHHVEAVFAVNRRVYGTDRFARRVLAMLTRHRLVHDFRILRPFAGVLVVRLPAGVIAVDADPVHRTAVRHLQFAYDRDVVLSLAGDHTRAAPGAHIQIDIPSPLLR